MRKIIVLIFTFLFSFVFFDYFLSYFFDKEINNLINNNIDIIPIEESRKQIDWTNTYEINNIPLWDADYRGPYFGYSKEKSLNCRILGIGDSIIWGSGVNGNETYFSYLSDEIKNTELINYGVPGFDILQEIIKYNTSNLGEETDLLIWHIWKDDNHIYKLINGTLFDSNIKINDIGKPSLFSNEKLNNFLLKKSYLYNEILKIKMKGELKKSNLDNNTYLINELNKVFNSYLSQGKNKKILIILSPDLSDNNKESLFYNAIYENFKNKKNINIIYLSSLLKGVNLYDIKYDDCCHFNIKGHKIISNVLYKYIKSNKLLDEKCY